MAFRVQLALAFVRGATIVERRSAQQELDALSPEDARDDLTRWHGRVARDSSVPIGVAGTHAGLDGATWRTGASARTLART